MKLFGPAQASTSALKGQNNTLSIPPSIKSITDGIMNSSNLELIIDEFSVLAMKSGKKLIMHDL